MQEQAGLEYWGPQASAKLKRNFGGYSFFFKYFSNSGTWSAGPLLPFHGVWYRFPTMYVPIMPNPPFAFEYTALTVYSFYFCSLLLCAEQKLVEKKTVMQYNCTRKFS